MQNIFEIKFLKNFQFNLKLKFIYGSTRLVELRRMIPKPTRLDFIEESYR